MKYFVDKSMKHLDKVPELELRVSNLEKAQDRKDLDFKSLESELRRTSERLVKVETLLEQLLDRLDKNNH